MSNKNIHIQVNEELEREAAKLHNSLGLYLSTAIKLFLKQNVRVNGLLFKLKLTTESQRALSDVESNDL